MVKPSKKAVRCPCCEQLVKLYSRKMVGSAVACLFKLARLNAAEPEEYFHLTHYAGIASASDFSRLRYWGFIEQQMSRDKNTPYNGMYRITNKGRDFINNRLFVQERILLYNQTFYGFEGDQVNVVDALGNKFDYAELMG